MDIPLRLQATAITKRYPRSGELALKGVSAHASEGEVVTLIGESGSGKSTLARIMLGLRGATSGNVTLGTKEIRPGSARSQRWFRRLTGTVLQDPYASLDPRRTVADTVRQPLQALAIEGDHQQMVAQTLERVGLSASFAWRYPHQLSGGQRQRVAIARAIIHRPRILVGDEPLSALDVTVRAQILALLRRLHAEDGIGIVLISHDLGLVQNLADRIYVLHQGRVVEEGTRDAVLGAPQHEYTQQLLSAVPRLPAPHLLAA